MQKKLTLIIPCFNEEAVLAKKIKDCLKSGGEFDKIIIVDDHSSDRTAQIALAEAKKNPKIIFLPNRSKKGKTSAVRLGITKAKTDLVGITDADVLIEKGALTKIAAVFDDPRIGLVGAEMKIIGSASFQDKIFRVFRATLSSIDSLPFFHGQLMVIRKSLKVYPRAKIQADDIDLAVRVRLKNFRAVFAPGSFFLQDASDKNNFAKRLRRDEGTIKALWYYKSLLFNRHYGRFGLICFPACFFLYCLQPVLFTFLVIYLFFNLSWLFRFIYILILLAVPFFKNLVYFNLIVVLAMIRVFTSKSTTSDSWKTQRSR